MLSVFPRSPVLAIVRRDAHYGGKVRALCLHLDPGESTGVSGSDTCTPALFPGLEAYERPDESVFVRETV